MWKILSPIRIIDRAPEEDFLPEEGEGEEDLQDSQIMIQEIHTSTANITEEVIVPKGAQKPRITAPEFNKKRQ
jgi:hypothetical protein